MRRICFYLMIILLAVMLCACQGTDASLSDDIAACAAAADDHFLGIPVCSREDAKLLKASRTASAVLPDLYSQDALTGELHTVPTAQNDNTPTYYLPLDMANAGWDSITLSSDASLFLVTDDPLPEKAEALSSGRRFTLLICGERFYTEAAVICTGLPVLKIDLADVRTGVVTASTDIQPLYDSPMYFSYYDPCDPTTQTVASAQCAGEIHTRGGTSAKYDKHSFKFSLYDDITRTVQNNLSMCGLRRDDDWVLNAMYQEETKVRDMLAYDLWEDIGADHYGDGTVLGTRMRYVEVILGGKYWGLYGLCEPEDAKQLGLAQGKEGCVYKVGSWVVPTVDELRDAIRNDRDKVAEVELKYPDITAENARDAWKPFLDYVEITYESSDFTFSQQIGDVMDEDNLADMWIFLNITAARDNCWKNLYLTYRADVGKLVMAPWDCDISFGLNWQAESDLHLYHEPYSFYEVQTIHIFDRYLENNVNGFIDTLTDRWNELRADWLNAEEIIARAHAFRAQLEDSGALARNRRKWPDSGDTLDLSYIEEFVNFRIPYLDAGIASLSELK